MDVELKMSTAKTKQMKKLVQFNLFSHPFLTRKDVFDAVEEANQKFGADLKLIGSWQEVGYSKRDIDVVTERGGKPAIDAAKYIAQKTGMLVDVFLAWVHYPRLDRNIWVFPDGKWGYGIDFMVEGFQKREVEKE